MGFSPLLLVVEDDEVDDPDDVDDNVDDNVDEAAVDVWTRYASPLRSIEPITRMSRWAAAISAIFLWSLLPPITRSKNALNIGHFLIAVHVASVMSLRITAGPSRVMWPRRFLSA